MTGKQWEKFFVLLNKLMESPITDYEKIERIRMRAEILYGEKDLQAFLCLFGGNLYDDDPTPLDDIELGGES